MLLRKDSDLPYHRYEKHQRIILLDAVRSGFPPDLKEGSTSFQSHGTTIVSCGMRQDLCRSVVLPVYSGTNVSFLKTNDCTAAGMIAFVLGKSLISVRAEVLMI